MLLTASGRLQSNQTSSARQVAAAGPSSPEPPHLKPVHATALLWLLPLSGCTLRAFFSDWLL
jgi:hypothetical protein